MMKIFFLFLTLSIGLFANNDTCKKCHPTISAEFESSMHKKSSIYEDKVHASIWNLHPLKKKDDYKCAKCHTPNATTKAEQEQGITCISCHTIMDVEQHAKINKNIYSKQDKVFYSREKGKENQKVVYKQVSSWFGMHKSTVGSAYHDIDYTNKMYYDGKLCMGCHSHKQNAHAFSVCKTEDKGAQSQEENCITCHMPKVKGTATTVKFTKEHAYHGFAGAHMNHEMLSKYVALSFKQEEKGFNISIENKAPHALMTHPLRVVQLRTVLVKNAIRTSLKTHSFVKVIGKEGKPSMPWLATEVVKDTMIKADETRVVRFEEMLSKGDTIEVQLGYYVVNQKVLKKLNLQDDEAFKKFTVLKSTYFTVK